MVLDVSDDEHNGYTSTIMYLLVNNINILAQEEVIMCGELYELQEALDVDETLSQEITNILKGKAISAAGAKGECLDLSDDLALVQLFKERAELRMRISYQMDF